MYWAAIPGFISLVGILTFAFTLLGAKAKAKDIGKHVTGLAVSLTLLLASLALIVENVLFFDKYDALEAERDQLQAALAAFGQQGGGAEIQPPEEEIDQRAEDEEPDAQPMVQTVWSESVEFDASNRAEVVVTKDETGALGGHVRCEFGGADTLLENIRMSVFVSGLMDLGVNDFTVEVSSGSEHGEYVYQGGVLAAATAIAAYGELQSNDYIAYWDEFQSIMALFKDVEII